MATLLGTLSESISSGALDSITKAIGLSSGQSAQGLDVAGPLLLGSLARKSQSTSGLDSIMNMLPDAGGLLSKLTGGGAPQAGTTAMLSGLLGPGTSTIAKALSTRLGFNIAPLLTMAAPALLGAIGSAAKQQGLNAAGIAGLLQKEQAEAISSAKPEVRALLDEATKLGDDADQLKAAFTNDEWTKIRLAPVAATFYVVSASVSNPAGIAKEVMAAGSALKEIVDNAMPTSLVDVAYGSLDGKLTLEGTDLEGAAPRDRALQALKIAAAAVKAKSPVNAKAFGEALVALSQKVAEASKEGGFLGFGGTRVSKDEELAIAAISAAVV